MDGRFIQDSGTNVYTGCELLVKGALESGVSLLTGYPGSPIIPTILVSPVICIIDIGIRY